MHTRPELVVISGIGADRCAPITIGSLESFLRSFAARDPIFSLFSFAENGYGKLIPPGNDLGRSSKDI